MHQEEAMKPFRKKRPCRKRKCLNCSELFKPDYRNTHHQRYCEKPDCRLASKKASQSKWLCSKKGAGYFKGAQNVIHVQKWRKKNPGYWRKKSSVIPNALQEDCFSQPVKTQCDTVDLTTHTLQDLCSLQVPLLLGLISNLTGDALQDNICHSIRNFIHLGHDILGNSPAP
jgi:hypothetical protein